MTNIDDAFSKTIGELGLTQTAERKKRTELGQDEFLKLMITQLKNQDPFKPLENGDFIAQMAQFSSVSGLQNLQKSFEGFAASMQSNQALQASTMVGRQVVYPTDSVIMTGGAALTGSVNLPSAGQNIVLRISSAGGELVREINLAASPDGESKFRWDGLDNNGDLVPAGKYILGAEAQLGDSVVALETKVNAQVESVTLDPQSRGITLNLLGMDSIAFSAVTEIR